MNTTEKHVRQSDLTVGQGVLHPLATNWSLVFFPRNKATNDYKYRRSVFILGFIILHYVLKRIISSNKIYIYHIHYNVNRNIIIYKSPKPNGVYCVSPARAFEINK